MDLQVLLSQFKTTDSKKANLTSITGGKWEIPEKSVKELYKLIRQTQKVGDIVPCLLYTSPSPRDVEESRMPSSA